LAVFKYSVNQSKKFKKGIKMSGSVSIEMHVLPQGANNPSQVAPLPANQAPIAAQGQMWQTAKRIATLSLLTTTLIAPAIGGIAGGYFLGGSYISNIAHEADLNDVGVVYVTAVVTVVSGVGGGGVGAFFSRYMWYVFDRPALPCIPR
jgi:hypothetical protein